MYVWWPLAEEYLAYVDWHGAWWRYIDWLLLGIFGFMSITIIARANLKTDLLIIFVGVCGGLAIESWGTQTNLWHYYTAERPPLWIIPAWPIASLSIDRITRFLDYEVRHLLSLEQSQETLDSAVQNSLLDHFRFLPKPDADLRCPDLRQILYLVRAHPLRSAGSHAYKLSLCIINFSRRFRVGILS